MLFVAALALGLMMYPHYRVAVRGWVLDRSAPWASNLFDLKEYAALMGAPLVAAVFALGRLAPDDRSLRTVRALCAVVLCLLVSVSAVFGLLVTAEKAV